MEELLARGLVPVVNENNSVAIDELSFGDKDWFRALVARAMELRGCFFWLMWISFALQIRAVALTESSSMWWKILMHCWQGGFTNRGKARAFWRMKDSKRGKMAVRFP